MPNPDPETLTSIYAAALVVLMILGAVRLSGRGGA